MANLTNLNNKFLVQTGGNVGINVTSPSRKLHIDQDSTTAGALYVYTNAVHTGTSTNSVVSIRSDNASASGTILDVRGDGTGDLINVHDGANEVFTILDGGNVGIGTDSPGTKLDIGGMADPVLRIKSDAGGDPELRFDAAAANRSARIKFYDNGSAVGGFIDYLHNGDKMNFGAGSSTGITMTVGDGVVGIGSTSPQTKFVVQHTDGGTGIEFSMGASLSYIQCYNRTSSDYIALKIDAEDLRFGTNNGTERMRIDSSGNVGIGTTDPAAFNSRGQNLVVAGSGNVGITINSDNTDSGTLLFSDGTGGTAAYRGIIEYDHSTDSMEFSTAATERMRIASGGEIGVGVTPKSWTLFTPIQIGQASSFVGRTSLNQTDVCNNWYYDGAEKRINTGYAQRYVQDSSGDHYWLTGGTDAADSAISFDTRMIIKNDGNVGIGITSPSAKLHVNGVVTANDSIQVQNDDSGFICRNSAGTVIGNMGAESSSTPNVGRLTVRNNGNIKVSFNSNGDSYIIGGNVGIGKTNPSTDLNVQGVITAGDSTTDGAIRRQHQTFATMKPGPTSGGSVDMMFVDHTHALDITVMAYVNTSNVATGRGYSVAAYGSASAGLTQTAFAGVISALSISYVNTGGSENYVLRVTTTYTGATAPTLSVTATGQSASELRAAT